MAKGNEPMAVGLTVILAGSSAIVAPLLLLYLLPLVAKDANLEVHALKIVTTLLLSQLIPLCVGLALRQGRPRLAERMKGPATRLSTALNLTVFGAVLVVQFHLLARCWS